MAQNTNCAIVMIGHLNKTSGSQSTYRGFGSIDITAVERSLLFIGKVKNDPTTRVIVHEKSSLAPPGQSLAFSLGDEIDFRWIGAYDICVKLLTMKSAILFCGSEINGCSKSDCSISISNRCIRFNVANKYSHNGLSSPNGMCYYKVKAYRFFYSYVQDIGQYLNF